MCQKVAVMLAKCPNGSLESSKEGSFLPFRKVILYLCHRCFLPAGFLKGVKAEDLTQPSNYS